MTARRNSAQRRASRRNWALFILRGFAGNLKMFQKMLPEPDYNRLYNAVHWAIRDIEMQYPWRDEQ